MTIEFYAHDNAAPALTPLVTAATTAATNLMSVMAVQYPTITLGGQTVAKVVGMYCAVKGAAALVSYCSRPTGKRTLAINGHQVLFCLNADGKWRCNAVQPATINAGPLLRVHFLSESEEETIAEPVDPEVMNLFIIRRELGDVVCLRRDNNSAVALSFDYNGKQKDGILFECSNFGKAQGNQALLPRREQIADFKRAQELINMYALGSEEATLSRIVSSTTSLTIQTPHDETSNAFGFSAVISVGQKGTSDNVDSDDEYQDARCS